MLQVFEVARHVFWNDSMYERKLLPSEATLESSTYTLTDLSIMTGKERVAVLQECGIDSSLYPLFLRSIQHLTAVHGPGIIRGNYLLGHLSARQWHPFGYNSPLLGYPSVNSTPFREKCTIVPFKHTDRDVTPYKGSRVQYNGLLNQGATCYLNSLLQALFHLSEFRSIIYKMPTKEEVEEPQKKDPPLTKSIPYALQRLFCMLQTSSQAIGTTELTESFGWGAADSFIQHDVHELTRVLLDNLEKKLCAQYCADGIDKKDNAIHRLFNGTLESYVKVEEVGYYGAREEPFDDLQLVVKNTKDIYASLDTFFQVEVLDGKNKYCLETGAGKSYHRAEKGVRLKVTPPIMLLHLARFDFDIECGEKKVFSRWDYYSTLDLSRYMPHASADATRYTLCSVLVHSGSNTGFGHYFCYLQCLNQWYKFNDEVVSPATLPEVFGANFGGCTINYWGSEVPCTTNAYMLVYVRTSQLDYLLRPIGPHDVPDHVVEQLRKEELEVQQLQREKAEDHLYGRLHLVDTQDLIDHEELLCNRCPLLKYPSQKTMRIKLDEKALPALREYAARHLHVAGSNPLFWYSPVREPGNSRLSTLVTSGVNIGDILMGDECCVLMTRADDAAIIKLEEDGAVHQIFHHKLYDPLQLRVTVLGTTVVKRNPSSDSNAALSRMRDVVCDMISVLPDESQARFKHHLTNAKMHLPLALSAEALLRPDVVVSKEENVCTMPPLRGRPTGELSVLRELESFSFVPCDMLESGDLLVWQLPTTEEERDNVFYPSIISFQEFLKRRIPVTIKLNLAPLYATLISTELADNMTYEQLQRYIAQLIGERSSYDHVRFTRHNPETELPYFMKGKKKDRPTLAALLTPSSSRISTLSTCLYYEYCKFSVTEIENAHSLQFKLYSESVKPVSSHWILISRKSPITARGLFRACIKDIHAVLIKMDQGKPTSGEEGAEVFAHDSFFRSIAGMDPEDGWEGLRLVDVWRGRIYNILDRDHPLVFEHQTFEESAEYRIERIPQPVPEVPLTDQFLLQVCHFTMIRQRKDPVETHSEPFSIYVVRNESPGEFLLRVSEKLELSCAAVVDWKVCLVKESCVVQTQPDVCLLTQALEFCPKGGYQANQKEPHKAAFLGLEHAPVKRTTRREEQVVILN